MCKFDLHGNIPGLPEEEQRCILLEGPMKMIEKQGRVRFCFHQFCFNRKQLRILFITPTFVIFHEMIYIDVVTNMIKHIKSIKIPVLGSLFFINLSTLACKGIA